MHASAHVDTFARDNLPDENLQPDFIFSLPELDYPERLNCAAEFLDRRLAAGDGERISILAPGLRWTYAQLCETVNRIAGVLVRDFEFVPGNRVLLRAANTPMMIASYLAVLKAGGVVVASMPLLRAKELSFLIDKARISLVLCDARLTEEMEKARGLASDPPRMATFGPPDDPGELEILMTTASPDFTTCDTAADDVCLIAFTSGTTGVPKGTMHVHRDMLAICDTFSRHVLKPERDDLFTGSPPIAFTFGLGGIVLFPLRIGAATLLLEKTAPPDLAEAIAAYRPTILFTAPTAYRAMLSASADLSSLRRCVSAGEALPKATFEAWKAATGLSIIDGIGATEMLHIFISASDETIRPGATGKPVPGYEARIIGPDGKTLPPGVPGRLAVRGPTGCRYLADERQTAYVQDGWNITGDTYLQDEDGWFWFQARSDDMIISSGYNIAGPEVEAVLLDHPAVQECGVVGAPDDGRGRIVKAYVAPKPGVTADAALAKALQDHVKAQIAPYKYPRSVVFVSSLPRTETGKLQRFALRRMAEEEALAERLRRSNEENASL